ncbi:amino acid ABC transporter substrate-binding protein [Demequina capsici]|uniref:Amino acid ABC transporter substrate-binding protein n=1 Tax=Demequina capsici TaxID=3075620 RepID=A0AA96F905_9MICO|nr:amino acid ABC transporter substrate-binding protein [Demequina sp. OYTSA14]WNM23930.1 amino acid ABC transporter substrate-binding protein [Demequina sp. OYTSA14]
MRSRPILAISAAALTVALAGCTAASATSNSSAASTASGAEAEAADTSLTDVQDAGVLIVGTEGTYRPFTYHEDGSGDLTGYDVEVIKAVADQLGVEVQFEETQWDAIFAGLDAGRFDVIANQVSITPEREQKYEFSEPYTYSTGVVVVADTNTDITSVESLAGKRTAQSLTSNWYTMAEEAGAEIEPVEGWAQAVALVRDGRVDATVNDLLTYLDYAQQGDNQGLRIAVQTDDVSRSAFAFAQGSDALVAAIDQALADLQADGTLESLSRQFFGADVSVAPAL